VTDARDSAPPSTYDGGVKRAWHAYLAFDWKVGEALGGVLHRFLTLWVVWLVGSLVKLVVKGDWASVGALPVVLLFLLWLYQPARIWRRRKYADSSVRSPSLT
jgi:hypothetical protein